MTDKIQKGNSLLNCYDPESMDFLKWLNQFEFIVDFVNIDNNLKVEFLLRKLNTKALSDITEKVAPHNPYSLPYEELISHLEELYGVYQGDLAANYRFTLRHQFAGESSLNYINALSRIASKVSDILRNNESLMVRFIYGLNNENTRSVLRSMNDLTLKTAVSIAVLLESIPDSIETD
ncbi:uncharacterized protein LOC122513161 [Polistes fuscatus]|uniref:uncharacterized protein LOC122513161 n=1 Tax=Polistes fuscatus TaxID=30207 RepID=UPI001CAA058B|nr:uncharacterized protein LOC122513161 [Polistes fuscatus]